MQLVSKYPPLAASCYMLPRSIVLAPRPEVPVRIHVTVGLAVGWRITRLFKASQPGDLSLPLPFICHGSG